jgi:ATP-dependent DNA helicase
VASDDAVVTERMLEEEKHLAEERAQKEAAEAEALLKATPNMDEAHFSKLDQLLNQTKIYSQFLLERMDDIAMVGLSRRFVLRRKCNCISHEGAS